MFNSGLNEMGEKVPLKMTAIAGENFGLVLQFYANFYENLSDQINEMFEINKNIYESQSCKTIIILKK